MPRHASASGHRAGGNVMQQPAPQGHALLRSAAWVVAVGAWLSGPVAMLVVSVTHPQPAWSGPAAFRAHYHAVQTVPYLLGFGLLTGFVLFTAACHAAAKPEQRARTSAALVFTAIYASLVFLNYTLQVGFIPRMLALDPAAVASLTMANPTSLAWFLEMFGYAALGMATWLVAPLFEGGGRARIVRTLLQANGFLSVAGAVCTAVYERWVFSAAGLV